MAYKKLILEQSDSEPQCPEYYVPSRGEAFTMGMASGWQSANRVFPVILAAVLMVMMFVC